MWNSLLNNTRYNLSLNNSPFRNYLSRSQLDSIQKKLNDKKKDYLEKINNPLDIVVRSNNFSIMNFNLYNLSSKTTLFLLAITSFTTSLGYFIYIQYKK